MSNRLFSNTSTLVKFIFRRERISTTIWIFCILALTLAVALAFPGLMKTEEDRASLAFIMENPAMVAMIGPNYGVDNYTNGAMMSNMMLLFTVITVAVMNIFLVVKHTRRDEEEGRVELVRSLPVGRLSHLSATMIVCIIVNVLLSLLIGLGLFALQLEDMDLHGSLLYGISCGIIGILFASTTAVFCQLAQTSRGAVSYSFMFLGVAYLIKCAEASHEVIAYLSPFSFVLKTEAYVRNLWEPVLILLGFSVIISLIAFRLNISRDLGEGIIPAKPGRKNAKKGLLSPSGLAGKLTRPMFIGWLITMLLLGMSYGAIFGDFGSFIEGNDMFKKMMNITDEELIIDKLLSMNPEDLSETEAAILEAFLASHGDEVSLDSSISIEMRFVTILMSIMAIASAVPTLMMLFKFRNEEKKGFNEHLLSRNVSKMKLLNCYFIRALITSVIMIFGVVFGLWSAAYASMEEPFGFMELFKTGIVYIPAIWFVLGIGLLIIAFLPRLTSIVWGILGYSFFAVYLGTLLQLPKWMAKLTPFGYVPQIPVEDMNWTKLFVLSALALVFMVIGFIGYKKRDMVF